MLLFLRSWLTGRPGWGCVLYFIVKLLFVLALESSWGVRFCKELLPLCAPVRRLFPQKLEFCDSGGRQKKVTTSLPKRGECPGKLQTSASVGDWQLCLQGSVVCCEHALEQWGAPEFGVDSGCAVIAGESVSRISRWLPPCTEMCLNLLVWNSTDTHSVALVPSRDKWEGVIAFSTPWILKYTF